MERVRREREHEARQPLAPVTPAPIPAERILQLQQGAGNAAVARLLARDPSGAPALEAPAETFTPAELSGLLVHLQEQMGQAQRESAAAQIADTQAGQAAAVSEQAEPKPRGGVLGALAKPVRRLGSALKKAGAWLGMGGKRAPAAPGPAPETAAASSGAAEADRKLLQAMIGQIDEMIQAEQERIGRLMESATDLADTAMGAIDPAEREQIVRQSGA